MVERKKIRFCKSKKKRILKKWNKNEKNFANVPNLKIMKVGDKIFVHPITFEKIKRAIEEKERNEPSERRSYFSEWKRDPYF